MNKPKKKKQVPIEPLQETPNPMSPCEPAAPQVETFEEKVARATRSMSPEKSRVIRLCMESQARDKWCASIDKSQRHLAREAKALKRLMRDRRARQNLVPKARTKKELTEQKEHEEKLAASAGKSTKIVGMKSWCKMHIVWMSQRGGPMQKLRASSDCCVTLVVSGECVCGTYISGSLFF